MTKLMTKNMIKLMDTRKSIYEQTKYDHIFCRVIRDHKLATKIAIWSFICGFWSFFCRLSLIYWTLISHFLVTNLVILYVKIGHLVWSLIFHFFVTILVFFN